MQSEDAKRYHELRAIHLRELAAGATTAKIKRWLLVQAAEEERLAGDDELALEADDG